MGIGLDDAFVIVDSVEASKVPLQQLVKRVSGAVGYSGAAILTTSLTSLVAFGVEGNTVLPGVQDFAVYAALGVFFDFVFQVTFFVACVTLDGRRQLAGVADGCCCRRPRCLLAPSTALTGSGLRERRADALAGTPGTAVVSASPPSHSPPLRISHDGHHGHRRGVDDEVSAERNGGCHADGDCVATPTPTSSATLPSVAGSNASATPLSGVGVVNAHCVGVDAPAPLRLSQRVIGVWLPRVVLTTPGMVVVLVATFALLAGGIVGLSRQHLGASLQCAVCPCFDAAPVAICGVRCQGCVLCVAEFKRETLVLSTDRIQNTFVVQSRYFQDSFPATLYTSRADYFASGEVRLMCVALCG
jgi:hypothetical protein